ncbi:uncharacterized protein [Cicer arietinum]|uniref:Uncharacterized protein LOC101506210 isoform X2 n=1 Tax=Cicer arietinum TaxID=3827 RepID=A0A3Q7YCT0_CICAR|nr:uncharacterized protein LOC101506210 isoform X2 [Cicer arietinum]
MASAATTSIFKFCVSLKSPFIPISFSFQKPISYSTSPIFCTLNIKSETHRVNKKKTSSPTAPKKKEKKKKKKNSVVEVNDSESLNSNDFELLRNFSMDADLEDMELPEPPTGFVLDDNGTVTLSTTNRLATIVDPISNLPLECVIRRVFKSSDRDECMLLCPVDTPVQILKSTRDGWSAISDEEDESVLPAAAYALAKIHMHLVYSGYCYTARGGFCYTDKDILDFHTDDGKEVDGLPSEGVEITYFYLKNTRYLIYTPPEPVQFVVVKDENGMFQMADDDLLDDPAVIDSIDEETEFNALVIACLLLYRKKKLQLLKH